MRNSLALSAVVLSICLAPILLAQDAAKVDSKHYTVVTDNARVRVLKVHYGPHEKSVMHSHPAGVAVFLTDAKVHFTLPGGKTMDSTVKAGETAYTPAQVHLPENVGDTPMDLILVELKGKAAPAAKTEMK